MKCHKRWVWMLPALLVACHKAAPPQEPVRPVKTTVIGLQAAGSQFALPGEVHARHESPLGFRVGGKVSECRANLGDAVKRGQVLARMESTDYQLNEQAGAASVAELRSNVTFADAELARYRALREKGFVSAAVLEQKQAVAESARARLNAVQSSHSVQSHQLDYTQLTADQDGILTGVDCNPGQVVAVGQPVFRLAQGSEREVEVHLPESVMPGFSAVAQFRVTFSALPGKVYTGKLRELAAAADPATRTYAARIHLTDADAALRLGMSANVAIQGSGIHEMRLPLAAVFSYDQQPQVWKVDKQNTVHAVKVSVAGMQGNELRIDSGLMEGDVVVVAGANLLREGQQVRLTP